ncbi:F0F1 ATP synthase subunit A, partial [Streptomyces cyaneofuscatus]
MQKELLVTDAQTLAFETNCHLFKDCGFQAPSVWSFIFEPLFTIGPVEFNKPMLLAIIGTFAILAFFWAGFSKPKVVPGKLQMVAEALYD